MTSETPKPNPSGPLAPATGGVVAPPAPYLVGERPVECFIPGAREMARAAARAPDGWKPGDGPVHVVTLADGRPTARPVQRRANRQAETDAITEHHLAINRRRAAARKALAELERARLRRPIVRKHTSRTFDHWNGPRT